MRSLNKSGLKSNKHQKVLGLGFGQVLWTGIFEINVVVGFL